ASDSQMTWQSGTWSISHFICSSVGPPAFTVNVTSVSGHPLQVSWCQERRLRTRRERTISASPGQSALSMYCVPLPRPFFCESFGPRLSERKSGASASVQERAKKVLDRAADLAFLDMADSSGGDPPMRRV